MSGRPRHSGFTLFEVVISLAVVVVLLATLVPALASARRDARRSECASNHRVIGQAWHAYLEHHDDEFPYVPAQPGWHYAGVRFSIVDDSPFLDMRRPLSANLPWADRADDGHVLRCPADHGITDAMGEIGTAKRTAFRSFGTSYRANAALLDATKAGLFGAHRGLRRAEIMTVPSRLIVLGDPVWYEVYEDTGRDANWHGDPGVGNLLFLDGSVKYMGVRKRGRVGPAAVQPRLILSAP